MHKPFDFAKRRAFYLSQFVLWFMLSASSGVCGGFYGSGKKDGPTGNGIAASQTTLEAAVATTASSSHSLYSPKGDSIDFSQTPGRDTDDCYFSQQSALAAGVLENGVSFYQRYDLNGKPINPPEYYSGRIQVGSEQETGHYTADIVIKSGPNAGIFKYAGHAHSHPNNYRFEESQAPYVTPFSLSCGQYGSGLSVTAYGHSTPLNSARKQDGLSDLATIVQEDGKPSYVLDRFSGKTEKLVYDKEAGVFHAYQAEAPDAEGKRHSRFDPCPEDICVDGSRISRVRDVIEKSRETGWGAQRTPELDAKCADYDEQMVSWARETATSNPNAAWQASQSQGTAQVPQGEGAVSVPMHPNSSSQAQGVPIGSQLVDTTVPAAQSMSAQAYETIDYRPVKNWATETINSAYSQATGIADSEGFGAEYRSRASPIVNQGLNYIQSIPDQVQVPVGP